jgi:hypothetical protein
MPSTNEVISLVNAADTAVRTACVLDLLKDSRQLPPFADEAIERAMAMLDDALKGSALIAGRGYAQGFSGNLDALCWATDSYIAEKKQGVRARPDPGDVEASLKQIQEEMNQVFSKIKGQSPNGARAFSFEVARKFFDSLANILGQRATASLTRPTRNYSSVL